MRMPATFGAVSRSLELALECLPRGGEFRTVLDIGAGTGSATHAAYLAADCGEFTCIEREPEMISVGRQLTEFCGVPAVWKQGDITSGIDDSAELVMCSYCLNELTETVRRKAVEQLWSSTQRLLLIVEPGTPDGYSRILSRAAAAYRSWSAYRGSLPTRERLFRLPSALTPATGATLR